MDQLTHWGRVTHKRVGKLTIIGSDNGLSSGRRPVIIWTNAGILLIRALGTNFSEILSEVHTFSSAKMHLKMSSAIWRPFVSISYDYLSRSQSHLSHVNERVASRYYVSCRIYNEIYRLTGWGLLLIWSGYIDNCKWTPGFHLSIN